MENQDGRSVDIPNDGNAHAPSPKRASPSKCDVISSPLAIIPITVHPDVTKEVECQSPPSQDLCYDDDEELSQLRRYYEEDKKESMRLKLHASTKECMTQYDLTSLDKGDLVNIELGPHERSCTFGREGYTSCLQSAAITSLGLICLSSRHCYIEWKEEDGASLYVTDLSSTNGTVVNSNPLVPNVPTRVVHGDIIRLAYAKDRSRRSCKIQYEVEDPRLCRMDTPCKSPAIALGHNVLGILFAGPLCYQDGPKLRSHDMLNFQKEYDCLKHSLISAANTTWKDHVNGAGVPMVHAAPPIDVSVSFATMDALHTMVSSKCRVLHYSGHGATNCLYFESDDEQGMADPIPYDTLVQILRGPAQLNLRLVVVNSCNSEHIANAFVECGVPHVIAIRGDSTVEDCEAVHFTSAFYLNLAMGQLSVEACFLHALKTISWSPHRLASTRTTGVEKFTLLPTHLYHNEVIFPHMVVPRSFHVPFEARFPNIWNISLPTLCPNFRFRSIEQLRLCAYLTEESHVKYKRWVWVTGPAGVGKTQLANALMAYLSPRMAFLGGVYHVSVAELCEDDASIMVGQENLNHPHERIYDKLECLLDELRACASRRVQRLHKLTRHIHGTPMLIVLDGCDTLLLGDAQMFTTFINTQLTDNIGLKVLTTSEYFCQTDRVHDHGLYVFKTPPMTRRASAKLLVDMVFPRKMSIHGMKRSPLYEPGMEDTIKNLYSVLAAHPAIQDLRGLPRAIFRFATTLLAQDTTQACISVDALLHP
ncbi:hypothetical protein H310_13532 [Aphanomyces invadans]|uniref:FHA domain-containing protein n=1 Tax=Aphanomyces invadans TaxID=157072 RepID=A0A024TEJ2_9STRA|nr:hypothetical protein H310_13532 [Aphanomyces invadans]ETV92006.1 hypothetical protein H310_13532 [Aphanomyces invadans]|eukprot:XP_008879303.1 hypothetical protein H310_13532 [Aphanomyces invadans]